MQSIFRKFQEISIPVKNIFEVLGYFKSILWQASKPLTIILLILSLGGGLTLVAELWAITSLINKLIEHDPSNSNFAMTIKILLPWVLLFIGAMLIKHSLQAFQPYISKQLEERATSIVKDNTFKKSLELDLRSFETEEYYNQLENAQQSINHRFTMAIESIGFLIGSIVELIVIIAAISKSGILFAILLIAGSIPLILLNIKASKEFVQVNYRQSPLKRHLNYWISLSTSRNTAAELRLFGLGAYFLKKWKNLSDQLIDELYKVRKRVASLRVKGEIILIVLLSIIIVGTVYAGVKGTISVGVLVASLYMLNRFEQAISQVGGYGEALSDFYFRFQYVPKFLKSGREEDARGFQAPKVIKHGIVFENVSFSYPGSSKPSLENIDLHIAAGERIAVVGENGAGKSTLALLLLGLYQPTKGRILIDGVDLKEINLVSWRAKAAAVFQNFVKYQLSAKDNITFGNIGVQDDVLKLKQSASLSGINDVLSQFSHGYETLLGKEYENSKDLSGGEWQKVAIARAYFRDAQILVLDEPTAALDAQSEYEVYRQFSQVSDGKTTMLISHRLGSARLADKIILLQSGQLMEIGSHDELVLKNGHYSAMYHLQAEWYQHREEEKDGAFGRA